MRNYAYEVESLGLLLLVTTVLYEAPMVPDVVYNNEDPMLASLVVHKKSPEHSFVFVVQQQKASVLPLSVLEEAPVVA